MAAHKAMGEVALRRCVRMYVCVWGSILMMSNPGWWQIIAPCQCASEDDAFRFLSLQQILKYEAHWQPLLLQSALWGGLICTNGVLWFLLEPDMLLHQPVIDYCCPQQCFFNAAWWCLMTDNRTSERQTRPFLHVVPALFVVNVIITWSPGGLAD